MFMRRSRHKILTNFLDRDIAGLLRYTHKDKNFQFLSDEFAFGKFVFARSLRQSNPGFQTLLNEITFIKS